MTQETKIIEIPVYRDSDGNPVCKDRTDNTCMFFYNSGRDTRCSATDKSVRRCNGIYYSTTNCPLWQGEV